MSNWLQVCDHKKFQSRIKVIKNFEIGKSYLLGYQYSRAKRGAARKIRLVKGDMSHLPYDNSTFDLIWSEGAIFSIGFEKGLRAFKPLLTDNRYLVLSELLWLRNNVPSEVNEYMKHVYPPIKTIQGNLDIARKVGYSIVGSFILPSESWWTDY